MGDGGLRAHCTEPPTGTPGPAPRPRGEVGWELALKEKPNSDRLRGRGRVLDTGRRGLLVGALTPDRARRPESGSEDPEQ